MRKLMFVAIVGGLVGAVLGLAVIPVSVWAQGGTFCWGAICQTSGGTIQFAANVQPQQAIVISTSPKFTAGLPGDYILDCQTANSVAPGAGTVALRARGGKLYIVVGGSPLELLLPVVRGGVIDTSIGLAC